METFFVEYSKQLRRAVEDYPTEYHFVLDGLPKVLISLAAALANRTYSKDGRAIKATCKVLGIKCTYVAINHYLNNHQ